ncbi:hypothetical protein AB0I82_30225 [Streptomyces sp. NPDC050315]|uniref:hypothetical protein n=1 Tax=Streptomyces sp. NPDC050315 TaxID=3155039 RepID=UPI0034361618
MSDNPSQRGATPATPEGPRAGDLLVRIGAIVFLIGAFATLATMAPLFLGSDPLPWVFYWMCMLMGAGFLIAAAGVLRSVAAQRRQAREASAQPREASAR